MAYTAFIGDAFTGSPLNQVLVQAFADMVRRMAAGPSPTSDAGPGT